MSGRPGRSGGPPRGGKAPNAKPQAAGAAKSSAVALRGSGRVATRGRGGSSQAMLVPEGYTVRKIEPAKNYDVVSFARAMNPDMGPRVQKLFEVEKEAALEAVNTGVYIGWRCSGYKHDCQRVGSGSKCFCGHLLHQHDKYNARSVRVPCRTAGCRCKAYEWMASKPEEIGEFWFQRRRDFDVRTWRAKCRCKHDHEEHDPTGLRRCKSRGCGCGAFDSNFLCAACDKHWEEHETVFESASDRQANGMQTGSDYLPFSEIPSLRNMVLTGEDDGDMSYMRLQSKNLDMHALPSSGASADNSTPFPGGAKSNFRPTYD